jgi:hypothetical protein
LKRQISCTSFCKGLHDPFVKHFPARPRPRHAMHLTRLPLFLDSLCVADSFSPDRFDLQSSQAPYGLDLVARSVLLSSTARDVGALAPPARAEASRGRSTEDIRRAGCLAATPMRVGEKFLHFFAPPQEHRLGQLQQHVCMSMSCVSRVLMCGDFDFCAHGLMRSVIC